MSTSASAASILTRREFDIVLHTLRPGLLRYAASRCGWQHAEDIVQSALVAAWSQIASFHPDTGASGLANFVAYFLGLSICNHRREMRRRKEVLLTPDEVLSLAERDKHPLLSPDVWRALCEEMYSLLERIHLTGRQEICIRMWLEGHTQQEIADYLGLGRSTVTEHIQAACARMRAVAQVPPEVEIIKLFIEEGKDAKYRQPYELWDRMGLAEQIQARRGRERKPRWESCR